MASASFQRMLACYTDNLQWQSARPAETHQALHLSGGQPLYLCHVFPLLHPSKLQAYQWDYHVQGMPRRYIREERFFGISASILGQRPSGTTSTRSLVDSIETTWLQLGHFVPSRKRVRSTSLRFAQYATVSYPGTLYRAGLTHTDQMQLNCSIGLSRRLPSR